MSRHPEDARLTREETLAKEERVPAYDPNGEFKQITTTQEGHSHDVCPKCRAELCGGLILDTIHWDVEKRGPFTDEMREASYGNSTCFSRLFGIELPYDDPNHYDGVSYWQCPDCHFTWDRFTGKESV